MRVAKVAYLSAVRRLLVLLLLPLSALANASLVLSPPTINADSYLVIDSIQERCWLSTTLIFNCRLPV